MFACKMKYYEVENNITVIWGDLPIRQLTYRQNAWNDVQFMLPQMRESALSQTLQVRITSDTQKIQPFDCTKWRCTL